MARGKRGGKGAKSKKFTKAPAQALKIGKKSGIKAKLSASKAAKKRKKARPAETGTGIFGKGAKTGRKASLAETGKTGIFGKGAATWKKDGTAQNVGANEGHEHFANPLGVPDIPKSYLSFESTKKILAYKHLQYSLWGVAVALSIFLLLSVATTEILSEFQILPHPSLAHSQALEYADALAIGIILIELATGFKHAKNKILFLKHNWLAIIAIFPFGLFVRAGRIFEGLYILEELALLRPLQVATKFRELQILIPAIELPAEFTLLDDAYVALSRALSRSFASISPLSRAASSAIRAASSSASLLLSFFK